MATFLIDVNLPYRFSIWHGDAYQHVFDLDDQMTDRAIWDYARSKDMVVVSKDADFSHLAMLAGPPPRVVHVCVGNRRLRELHEIIQREWPWVVENIGQFRLVRIFPDGIEAVE